MAYGENTKVSSEKTIADIIAMIRKSGGTQIAQLETTDRHVIAFTMKGRQVRFTVLFDATATVQRHRQRMRALLLVIKAKLESVESQVETFEQAFLANVVMPGDNATVYERAQQQIALEYKGGQPGQILLSGPASK